MLWQIKAYTTETHVIFVLLLCYQRYETHCLFFSMTTSPNILSPLCHLAQLWGDWLTGRLCRGMSFAWYLHINSNQPVTTNHVSILLLYVRGLIKYSTMPRQVELTIMILHGGSYELHCRISSTKAPETYQLHSYTLCKTILTGQKTMSTTTRAALQNGQ